MPPSNPLHKIGDPPPYVGTKLVYQSASLREGGGPLAVEGERANTLLCKIKFFAFLFFIIHRSFGRGGETLGESFSHLTKTKITFLQEYKNTRAFGSGIGLNDYTVFL